MQNEFNLKIKKLLKNFHHYQGETFHVVPIFFWKYISEKTGFSTGNLVKTSFCLSKIALFIFIVFLTFIQTFSLTGTLKKVMIRLTMT